jgi:hypothetical protein
MVEMVVRESKPRAEVTELPIGVGTSPLQLTVLGTKQRIKCVPLQLAGRRLVATLSAMVPSGTPIEIDSDDGLVLGEVAGIYREGADIRAVILLNDSLVGLTKLRLVFG